MKNIVKKIIFLLCVIFICSCDIVGNHETYEEKIVECTNINLNESKIEICIGDTIKIQVDIEPFDCTEKVQWKSNNINIATVKQNGEVTGVSNGETNISVSCGEISKTINVIVYEKRTRLFMSVMDYVIDNGRYDSQTKHTYYFLMENNDSRGYTQVRLSIPNDKKYIHLFFYASSNYFENGQIITIYYDKTNMPEIYYSYTQYDYYGYYYYYGYSDLPYSYYDGKLLNFYNTNITSNVTKHRDIMLDIINICFIELNEFLKKRFKSNIHELGFESFKIN